MRKGFDFLTFLPILAIGTISLLVIYSINKNLAASQTLFWLLGLIAFFTAANFNYKDLKKYNILLYVFVIACLLLLFIFGDSVRGSVRWIQLGSFRFQPSELAKVSEIFLLATFFRQRSAKKIKNIILSGLLVFPLAALVFLEPDLGNATSIVAIWFGVILIAGFRLKTLFALLALGILLATFSYELLPDYQKQRVGTFINPNGDPLGTGYNILQSKIAIGSGKVWGRGLGRGSQSQLNFLPEAESDFIFASISEQLGFVGSSILIILYVTLIWRISSTFKTEDIYGQLILAGVSSFLIFQTTINIGMNMALLPVTGITLPLVSYGGSSLVSTLFLLGIAFSVNKHNLADYS